MNDNFTSDTGTFQFGSLAAFQAGLGNNFVDHPRRPSVRRPAERARPVRAGQLHALAALSRSISASATTASWGRRKRRAASSCSTPPPARWCRPPNPYPTGHNFQPRVGVDLESDAGRPHRRARRVRGDGGHAGHQRRVADRRRIRRWPRRSRSPATSGSTTPRATALAAGLAPQLGRSEFHERPHADVERERRAADRPVARRDGRLLRLARRSAAHHAQPQSVRERRPAVPDAFGGEPDSARRRARQHHRDRQPRLVRLQGPVADGQPAAVRRAAVQRVVHAGEVHRHELAQHRRRSSCRTATTSATARGRRTSTSGTGSSINAIYELPFKGNRAEGRLADRPSSRRRRRAAR